MDKQKIIDKMRDAVMDRCKERIEQAKKGKKKPEIVATRGGVTSGLRERYGL